MGRIKVTCELKDYSEPAQPQIKVYSDRDIDRFVELEIDGKKYTVNADELRRAIENCTNVGF